MLYTSVSDFAMLRLHPQYRFPIVFLNRSSLAEKLIASGKEGLLSGSFQKMIIFSKLIRSKFAYEERIHNLNVFE